MLFGLGVLTILLQIKPLIEGSAEIVLEPFLEEDRKLDHDLLPVPRSHRPALLGFDYSRYRAMLGLSDLIGDMTVQINAVRCPVKNIQIIDGALNCAYDIFAATDEEFFMIFQNGADIAFIDEIHERNDKKLDAVFDRIWKRRLKKKDANGIHGIIFYELEFKKKYYPTRRDEEAINPDGTLLRAP